MKFQILNADLSVAQTAEFNQPIVKIGKSSLCDLFLNGEEVSRVHAQIEQEEKDKFVLTDRVSQAGTFVNGEQIKCGESCTIKDGDLIKFGDSIVRFYSEDLPESEGEEEEEEEDEEEEEEEDDDDTEDTDVVSAISDSEELSSAIAESTITSQDPPSPTSTQRGIARRDKRLARNQYDPGTLIKERYKIVSIIGSGGFGVVYEAEDTLNHDKRVAIKTLKHNVADYEMAAQRFEREIELCSKINSKHAVKIFDSGCADDETLFYVMEFLEGETLEDLLGKHEKLTFLETKNILLQVMDVLSEAHDKNIIHRDLKPGNIWLTPIAPESHEFDVKVLDFGIAKSLDPNEEAGPKLTQTGAWLGSPAYMSPEHLTGRKLTPATDIFSIGLIAIEMLTGYQAVEGDSPMDVAIAISSSEEIVIDDWILDSTIGNVIERCIKKAPEARYPDGKALAQALAALDDETLKKEYGASKIQKHAGRRSALQTPTNTQQQSVVIVESPELQKAHRQSIIQIVIGVGIILCIFAILVVMFIKVYGDKNFIKPFNEEQREQFDQNIQELVDARVKAENTKRMVSIRMSTGLIQGAAWGSICDDACLQRHTKDKNAPQNPSDNPATAPDDKQVQNAGDTQPAGDSTQTNPPVAETKPDNGNVQNDKAKDSKTKPTVPDIDPNEPSVPGKSSTSSRKSSESKTTKHTKPTKPKTTSTSSSSSSKTSNSSSKKKGTGWSLSDVNDSSWKVE